VRLTSTYPTNEEIFKFLEECEENNVNDRPVNILFRNFGMPHTLGIEYQKEFYERKRKS